MSEEQTQAEDSVGTAPFEDNDVASMEDILASIRSMIAEDDVPPADPTFTDTAAGPVDADTRPVAEASEPTASPARAMPAHDVPPLDMPFDIDALLEPIDLPDPDGSSDESIAADAAPLGGFVSDGATTEDIMQNIERLFEPPAPASDRAPATLDPVSTTSRDIGETEDMELVKSLMAELTEAPDTSDPQEPTVEQIDVDAPLDLAADWAADDISMPELDALESVGEDVVMHDIPLDQSVDTPDSNPAEPVGQNDTLSSFMDDIFEQTIADEESLNAAVELPEIDLLTDTGSPIIDTAPIAAVAGGSALSELAAQAEADAAAFSGRSEDLVESAPQLTVIETAPAPAPETEHSAPADLYQALEEEVMARNAPLEEIVAAEVESEAGSAFAELNRLVEEKQEFQDRGPRIGDLVQEALKPMLKEWLDENLSALVERAVQKEVKRIAGGK